MRIERLDVFRTDFAYVGRVYELSGALGQPVATYA